MGYFVSDRELVDPDFHDGVVRSFIDELPLQNAIGRIKGEVVDITQDVEVEGLPEVYDPAVAEGVDFVKANAQKVNNLVLTQVIEQFRSKGYQVSRLRQKIKGHNELKGQTAAKKRAVDARNLALSIERALSSEQEAATYAATNGKPITRGLMNWLQKGAHVVDGVPAALRPVAGYDADVTALTEALFKAECIKAKKQVGGSKLKLLGLVGIDLKVLMSEWLGKATVVNGVSDLVKGKIALICDEYEWDGVAIKSICDDNLLAKTSGAQAMQMVAAGYLSGAFIRPEMWGVQTLEPITHYETSDDGAGPGGYHDASLRLTCLNPMGQFRVKHVVAG